MKNINVKKLLILNLPYFILGLYASNLGEAYAIENYICFYNNGRYQKRLHCMTPMEFHYAYAA